MAIGNFPGTVTLTDPPRERGVLTSEGMKYGNFNRSIAGNTMVGAGAGFSSGGGAGRSRFGPFTGRPRIGSAAGAVGSAGVPTSQRGRAEKFGPEAASMPAWMAAEAVRNNGGGLSQTGGLPPLLTPEDQAHQQLMSDAGNFQPVQQDPNMNYGGSPKRIDPATGLPRYGRGTGIGRGRPVPHGQPFIAGDPQKKGIPNEELILPTPEGVHVVPLKDLPQLAAGTTPRVSKPPPVPLPAPKRPTHGMDDFYRLNPNTPPAYQKEAEKLIMNPRLPMPIRVPKLAHGTVHAIDELAPEFQDGEIRQDGLGNDWKYNARLRRGVPVNPYLLDPNAPTPISSFKATAGERYNDLANRLSALRQEGMSRGRARVAALQAEQNTPSDLHATGFRDGGVGYSGRYGTATIGRNVPRSFTVERADGSSDHFNNLADADVESRADAAQRRVEGVPMNTGRGVGAGAPTAVEYLTGVVEPSAIPEVSAAPTLRPALPDDRPSTVESRRRDWKMRSKFRPMTLDRAQSRAKEAGVRRSADFSTNLRTAIDLGLVQPVRDFGNNVSTAWDLITQ